MAGQATVVATEDWLTPFEVRVEPDGQPGTTARYSAAAVAQEHARALAEQGFEVKYDLCALSEPTNVGNRKAQRVVSAEEFRRRYHKRCSKCRESKPLADFDGEFHVNRTTGDRVFHGYLGICRECNEREE